MALIINICWYREISILVPIGAIYHISYMIYVIHVVILAYFYYACPILYRKSLLKKDEQSEEKNAQANKNNPIVKKIITEKHTEAKSKSIIRGNRRVINTDDGQKNIF